jgi:hypothetical protein
MKALAKRELVMYNITCVRRPTDRRPETDARSRTPGRAPVTCARGACEARGHRALGGTAQVRGRVGLVTVNPSCLVGAPRTAAHGKGARELRSGLRGVWTQAETTQAAAVNLAHVPAAEKPKTRRTNQRLQLSTESDQAQSLKQTVGATVFSAAIGRILRSQQPPVA